MNLISVFDLRFATEVDAAGPVRRFFAEHEKGLKQAALLLGGRTAANDVDQLVECLQSERHLTRGTRYRIDRLLALLRLEDVGDPDREEDGCFAEIDPAAPIVAEICLLTDGLHAASQAMIQHQAQL